MDLTTCLYLPAHTSHSVLYSSHHTPIRKTKSMPRAGENTQTNQTQTRASRSSGFQRVGSDRNGPGVAIHPSIPLVIPNLSILHVVSNLSIPQVVLNLNIPLVVPNLSIHQQKNTLRQIRLRCALTQAMSLLRSLRPVHPEFRRNARKHPVLPGLPGHALSILTRRCVVPAPWLRFYSLLSHDGASFTLSLPRALTYFSCHLHRRLVRPSSESHVYRVD